MPLDEVSMDLFDVVSADRTRLLEGRTKQAVLSELVGLLVDTGVVPDGSELERLINEREALMSTGIGLGIAVPHARIQGLPVSCIAFGTSPDGIQDYESIDGSPVRIVSMIITGTQRQREYIELLSSLARLFKDEAVRERVLSARSSGELWDILVHERAGLLA
jgi:mannitol/fructose-specific phosphotransferase system IIA component (Ntr-type)